MKILKNKKVIFGIAGGLILVAAVIAVCFATGVLHLHSYIAANCTAPDICEVCGETRGEALGHTWKEATCTEPKTCEICAETEGEALGHTWKEATCTEPKTCEVCEETEGEALGHTWKEAACTEPKTCEVCAKTEGEPAGHDFAEATCVEPSTCKNCGITEGEPGGHQWKEATCANPKTCEVCGETEGTALPHAVSIGTCPKCNGQVNFDVLKNLVNVMSNAKDAVDNGHRKAMYDKYSSAASYFATAQNYYLQAAGICASYPELAAIKNGCNAVAQACPVNAPGDDYDSRIAFLDQEIVMLKAEKELAPVIKSALKNMNYDI